MTIAAFLCATGDLANRRFVVRVGGDMLWQNFLKTFLKYSSVNTKLTFVDGPY